MTVTELQSTTDSELTSLRWFATTLAVLSVLAGLFIPEFYDWSGADQSRSAPVIGWVAIGIMIADVVLIVLLAMMHTLREKSSDATTSTWRFGMSHILIITTCVALFLAIAKWASIYVACRLLQLGVVVVGVWVAVQFPRVRFWIAWILFLQIAPFLWLVRDPSFSNAGSELLAILSCLPTLMPAALFVSANHESMQWILTLLTTAELAMGIWLSYLGPKRVIAWGIVVLTLSVFSSFVLNALIRM